MTRSALHPYCTIQEVPRADWRKETRNFSGVEAKGRVRSFSPPLGNFRAWLVGSLQGHSILVAGSLLTSPLMSREVSQMRA